jgi:hypothetical protein
MLGRQQMLISSVEYLYIEKKVTHSIRTNDNGVNVFYEDRRTF